MSIHIDPSRRHDFVLLFDVLDGNPNGDPDQGNLPRTDIETNEGLVTDVCLKRKIRNYVATYTEYEAPEAEKERLNIFVEHHGVLNEQIRRAYIGSDLPVTEPVSKPIEAKDQKILAAIRELAEEFPPEFRLEEEDDVTPEFSYSGELSEDQLNDVYKNLEAFSASAWKTAQPFIKRVVKAAGKPVTTGENIKQARKWMCANFFDVRMFGAVMSTGLNAGQVRGPLQLTFARSLDSIVPIDWAITRMAVTDANKTRTNLQTIGRKTQIPYGLYRGSGFFSPFLAQQTGVTAADLELFWAALQGMWDLDRSASRGLMALRGLYIFSHEKGLGNAPAHKLFDLIQVEKNSDIPVPRAFSDYTVTLPTQTELSEQYPGVTLTALEG